MANLHRASQSQPEHLGRLPLSLEQAGYNDVGIEHDSHFRRRARRVAAISASTSAMPRPDTPPTAAA